MSQLGLGVMINMLGGNEETMKALEHSINKKIKNVWLDEDENELKIQFEDNSVLILWDGGQSCCEHRYMRTDDDLVYYIGAVFTGVAIKDGGSTDNEWGDPHEIQFLEITTDKGVFQMANHNEHNGYYGGFWIQAKLDQVI